MIAIAMFARAFAVSASGHIVSEPGLSSACLGHPQLDITLVQDRNDDLLIVGHPQLDPPDYKILIAEPNSGPNSGQPSFSNEIRNRLSALPGSGSTPCALCCKPGCPTIIGQL